MMQNFFTIRIFMPASLYPDVAFGRVQKCHIFDIMKRFRAYRCALLMLITALTNFSPLTGPIYAFS